MPDIGGPSLVPTIGTPRITPSLRYHLLPRFGAYIILLHLGKPIVVPVVPELVITPSVPVLPSPATAEVDVVGESILFEANEQHRKEFEGFLRSVKVGSLLFTFYMYANDFEM